MAADDQSALKGSVVLALYSGGFAEVEIEPNMLNNCYVGGSIYIDEGPKPKGGFKALWRRMFG